MGHKKSRNAGGKAQTPAAPKKTSLTEKFSIPRTAGLALALFLLDAFMINRGVLSFLTAALASFHVVSGSIGSLFREKTEPFRPVRSVLFMAAAAVVILSNHLNDKMARARAMEIAGACEKFRAAEGRYPGRLEELVPDFLPEIPLAKYTLLNNKFRYSGGNIEYLAMPPSGRRYYSLEEKKWKRVN
ncbi:MAG: hypothetical protein COT17_05580 [Elusimicrobia bacterium CG08_land_8_20_14_0_20_51_18]|nr:MAG: hypothetical protein COT17_05580 [Elusimicrobia bacterium CG08_land_8_20_14_0_20_51_18]